LHPQKFLILDIFIISLLYDLLLFFDCGYKTVTKNCGVLPIFLNLIMGDSVFVQYLGNTLPFKTSPIKFLVINGTIFIIPFTPEITAFKFFILKFKLKFK